MSSKSWNWNGAIGGKSPYLGTSCTEQEISKTVFDNIKHLYPAGLDTLSEAEVADRLAFYSPHLLTKGNLTLLEFSQKIDTAYALEASHCLSNFRQLLA